MKRDQKPNPILFVLGLTCATISTISVILSFALPSWIYTYDRNARWGINYAGLWTFCLESFFDQRYMYDIQNRYGCQWIYSENLAAIRWRLLNPEWYVAVQIMATVNLILSLIGLIGLYVICLVHQNTCPLVMGIVSMFASSMLGFSEVILYALRVTDPEYYKVDNLQSKSLGAGWGFALIGALVSALSLIFLVISYMTIRTERRRYKKSIASQEGIQASGRRHDDYQPEPERHEFSREQRQYDY